MSIEKKSLISTLKTTKKANAVSSELAKPTNVTSKVTRAQAVTFKAKRADASMRRADTSMRRAEALSRKEVLNKRRK
jgi:hypothetical protein